MHLEDVDKGVERDPYGLYLDVPGRTTRRLHIEEPQVGEANAIVDELGRLPCSLQWTSTLSGAARRRSRCFAGWPQKSWTRIEQSLTPLL